jgi:hypothetical protein
MRTGRRARGPPRETGRGERAMPAKRDQDSLECRRTRRPTGSSGCAGLPGTAGSPWKTWGPGSTGASGPARSAGCRRSNRTCRSSGRARSCRSRWRSRATRTSGTYRSCGTDRAARAPRAGECRHHGERAASELHSNRERHMPYDGFRDVSGRDRAGRVRHISQPERAVLRRIDRSVRHVYQCGKRLHGSRVQQQLAQHDVSWTRLHRAHPGALSQRSVSSGFTNQLIHDERFGWFATHTNITD